MTASLGEILADRLLIIALVGFGLWATFRVRSLRADFFREMVRVTAQSVRETGHRFGPYQALTMSLAGRVGAGSIIGVGTALTLGGPGALFWMWVVGMLGMATSFVECTLAQVFKRRQPDGSFRGGPAFYIESGLRSRLLAMAFSVMLLVHSGYVMTAFQSFTVATALTDTMDIGILPAATLITAVFAIVVYGGLQRISRTADLLVPVMVIGYLGAAILVILKNLHELPGIAVAVYRSAFGLEPVLGAGIGAAIINGVKRGLFSNEAGLGTAPNVAAIAETRHPAAQGIVQALSVFIDTMLVCTATAAIVLCSDVYWSGQAQGALLTQQALVEQIGRPGGAFINLALVLFAFTSVMYSYYLAENCLEHLRANSRTILHVFRASVVGAVFWGSQQQLGTILSFADVVMAVLALTNLYALSRLLPTALHFLRDYRAQRAGGVAAPQLQPDDRTRFGMNRDAWEN